MNKESNKEYDLKNLTVEEIKQSYELQKRNGDWTFYQEREFVEGLLQTRFNFLITVYTLFLLSFFQANDKESKTIILFLGLIIVGIMGLVIYRTYVKFDVIRKILHNLDKYHVLLIQEKETKKRRDKLFGVNSFIGFVIPMFLFLSIIIMGILLIFLKFELR